MFTLKVRWRRTMMQTLDNGATIDDELDVADHFIPADRVTVLGHPDPALSAWATTDYRDMRSIFDTQVGDEVKSEPYTGARFIEVEHNGEHSWYLVTHAWLLGPTGDTIERLPPHLT